MIVDFKAIKKGDEIAIFDQGHYTYHFVDRVGSTWFRASGISFQKKDGRECGINFNSRCATSATPEDKFHRTAQNAHDYLQHWLVQNRYIDSMRRADLMRIMQVAGLLGWELPKTTPTSLKESPTPTPKEPTI